MKTGKQKRQEEIMLARVRVVLSIYDSQGMSKDCKEYQRLTKIAAKLQGVK